MSRRQKKSFFRGAIVAAVAAAFVIIQVFIGGPKLVFSLPAYLLLGVAGVLAVFGRKKAEFGNPNVWCFGSALLLAAYVCGRAFFSPVDYLARTDFFMTLGSLVAYVLVAVHLPRSSQRRTLMWVLFGLAMAHTVVGAIQFKEGQNFMALPSIFRPDYGARASGFYICPNHLAGLLEMLGMLALGFAVWARGKVWQRVLAVYAVVVCIAGVAISGSRGGYMSLVVGLIVFSAISLWVIRRADPMQFRRMLFAVAAGCAVVVASAVYLMLHSASLKSRLNVIYDPTNMRLLLWEAALQQFGLNPVFGTGSGTYLYLGRLFRSVRVQLDPLHVHNDYLELLAEYGVVGVLVVSIFVALHLRGGWVGINAIVVQKLLPLGRSKSTELALAIGAFSGIAAILVHSVVDFNLHIPANTLFVALLFGILALPTDANGVVTGMTPRLPWMRWLAPAFGAVLMTLAALKIPAEYAGERARVSLRDRQYPEAQRWAAKALRTEKKSADLYYYLGEAQHFLALQSADSGEQMRLRQQTVAAFQAGLALFPNDVRLLLKLGRTLDNLGRFAEGGQILEQARVADPNLGVVYSYLGLHWHQQGRLKLARKYYMRGFELGEGVLSQQGFVDLDRERTRSPDDPFADLISDSEMEEETGQP